MSQDHADDESLMVQLLTEVQLPLLLYVRSLMPGESAAQDVAQQVSATVWRKRGEFTPGTNFKAWVFSIARFEVLNHRKKVGRESQLRFHADLEEVIAGEIADASDSIMERHDALRHCLGKLRAKDRELLLFRYSSRGTLEAFAQSVDRSVNSLKVTLHRLRNALAECMQRQTVLREGNA